MSCRIRPLSWAVLGLLLAGATSPPDALEQVRQGDAAFLRGDYAEALSWYERAEVRITEPGLVAYNKGVTLYRLGNYAEAQACYRQCLADAEDYRRAGALFGLANCVVRQSGDFGAPSLREAIQRYRECLSVEPSDATLAEDARNNLELAKLLLLDAKESPAKGEPPPDVEGSNPRTRPNPLDGDRSPRPDGAGDQAPGPLGRGQQRAQPGQNGVSSEQQARGGVGNLPPVPDKGELVPLPPDVAAALLKQAGDRVVKARQAETPVPKDPVGVLDR